MGTTASIDVWANRDANVSVVKDSNGLIRLAEGGENGRFASTEDGVLSIDISEGGAGDGISVDSRVVIDDIFRIQNQAGDDQVVWIKDVNDDGGLFGDEGPLHFFRGPVSLESDKGNGVLGARRRMFSQLDPVPGTPDKKQRLTITGLVPAKAVIGTSPGDSRKGWINTGHPVTVVKDSGPAVSDDVRKKDGFAPEKSGTKKSGNVFLDKTVEVGNQQGRYFLTPGEEMKVGLAADFAGFDASTEDFDLGKVLDEIEVVSRSPEDARSLATGDTEFNPI